MVKRKNGIIFSEENKNLLKKQIKTYFQINDFKVLRFRLYDFEMKK